MPSLNDIIELHRTNLYSAKKELIRLRKLDRGGHKKELDEVENTLRIVQQAIILLEECKDNDVDQQRLLSCYDKLNKINIK